MNAFSGISQQKPATDFLSDHFGLDPEKVSYSKQTHILRRLLERFYQKQLSIVIVFIDFSKAFDSSRNMIWLWIRHYVFWRKLFKQSSVCTLEMKVVSE